MSRVRLTSIALGIACGPILCCWIAVASCFCPGRLHRHSESEDRKRFERRQVMAPRPLPVRPPERRLTIPVPKSAEMASSTERERGKTLDQSQSRLMQLPYELRQIIFRAAVGDSTMHMILKKNKLGHLRCKAPSAVECPLGYNGTTLSRECCWGTVDSANIWLPLTGDGDEGTDGDLLPLLQTCRQIYSESIDLVYSTNCFSFSDLDCLRYFSCTILPRRFDLIRTLDVEWCLSWPIYDPLSQSLLLSDPALYPPHDEATWEETWRIIADMPNLRFIRASLLYFYGFRDAGCERKMLAPLRKVTRPQRFEVHLMWSILHITTRIHPILRGHRTSPLPIVSSAQNSTLLSRISGKSIPDMTNSTTKTEALYQKDGHLYTHTSPLTSLSPLSALPTETQSLFKPPSEGDPYILTTPSTIFHAQGGGQPSDTGTITPKSSGDGAETAKFVVHQVRKVDPAILHLGVFESADQKFNSEEEILQSVDVEKRILHSRYHTAGHVIGLAINLLAKSTSGTASGIPPDIKDGKASHYPNAAFVEHIGLIPGTAKAAIQSKVDELVSQDLGVAIHFWSEEEASAKCIGGTDGAAIFSGDEVRVVDLGGLGSYPCGGTHVKSLKELGRVVVRNVKRQKGVSKVSYEVVDR
ncbi:hypothetical protein K458DRAFT_484502 [Lentithecium fluviatile CBS 122367]|uniref:Threonyl/alanyl tRNA synthetase SAD domain-containing protein n=1 Tax=Lentithecium fluviatile CBS 122367 TaxID=1168545 RepID=A0A6G1JD33_9PLEO|nr:hypothetical protein K458DRAFT_484502 [Lentithecium fluviatile CBS 122367]